MHNLIKEIERKFENIEHKIQAKTITTDETYAENLKKLTDFYNIESLTTKSSKPLNDERENLLEKLKISIQIELPKINDLKDTFGHDYLKCRLTLQTFQYLKPEFKQKTWSTQTYIKFFLLNEFKFANAFSSAQWTAYKDLLSIEKYQKNNRALSEALWRSGLSGAIEILFKNAVDINAKSFIGATPLMKAAETPNLDIVKLLCRHGAEINAVNNVGNTALIKAAQKSLFHIAKCLIEKGADVNAVNSNGDTPLLISLKNGCAPMANLLIGERANVNSFNLSGQTPLMNAAKMNDFQIVCLLFELGADLCDSKNLDG
jgi:hypothetical protein